MSEYKPNLQNPKFSLQQDGRFLLDVLGLQIDTEGLVESYHSILARNGILETPRADGSTLRSVSLTHRPGAVQPMYDGNNTQYDPSDDRKLFLERDFSVFNEELKDTAFYDIYRRMPFRVGRMRLNLLPPKVVFPMHRDSAPRAHVALITNPDCFLVAETPEIHHVPNDGNIYIFDTTLPHTAFNASQEARVHLTMSLSDFE
jgi:hypothetical protein